jgi:hypothetical protein
VAQVETDQLELEEGLQEIQPMVEQVVRQQEVVEAVVIASLQVVQVEVGVALPMVEAVEAVLETTIQQLLLKLTEDMVAYTAVEVVADSPMVLGQKVSSLSLIPLPILPLVVLQMEMMVPPSNGPKTVLSKPKQPPSPQVPGLSPP